MRKGGPFEFTPLFLHICSLSIWQFVLTSCAIHHSCACSSFFGLGAICFEPSDCVCVLPCGATWCDGERV